MSSPHYQTTLVRVEFRSGSQKKGLLRREEEVTYQNVIDKEKFATDIEVACNAFAQQGYSVISVVPLAEANYWTGGISHGGAGYGFSLTTGVVITAIRQS